MIAGLIAVGASAAQASSGLLALCVACGVLTFALSLWHRKPVPIVWSTPGAAVLLAAAGSGITFEAAIGAFMVCGMLVAVCGLVPALGSAMTRIPAPLANAMLAGILFPICLAPVTAVVEHPALAIPIVLVWAVLARLAPRWAVPSAMVVAVAAILISAGDKLAEAAQLAPTVVPVMPEFDLTTIVGLGLPLFIVTMAGQNVPGFAVLSSFGYRLAPRGVFFSTGVGSAVIAVFGAHTVNLAAITAAITASPEAHPDAGRRWIAGVSSGITFLFLAMFAGAATAIVSAAPPILIVAVAGLAVLGALISSITTALSDERHRFAAIATFLVTASGVAVFGIGSAFWGLLVGGVLMLWFGSWRAPAPARARR